MKKNLKKILILINIIIVATIVTLSSIKIFVIEEKEKQQKEEIFKQKMISHMRDMYSNELGRIHSILNKKIKFFSEKIELTSSNTVNQKMTISRRYLMLKQVLPFLSHIALYDKNLKLLYETGRSNFKKDRSILRQIISHNDENKIVNILEKSNEEDVFLTYAMKIEDKDKNIGVIEISVDITYLQEELKRAYIGDDMSFTLSLWDTKAGYDDLLIANMQILNYKSLIPLNYEKFVPSFIAMILMLLLVNKLFMYMVREFQKEEKKVKDILNSQSSLMVIFTKDEIISCNKAFVEALGFKDEEELISNHNKVNDFFIKKEEFTISPKNDMFWADYILSNTENSFYDIFLKDRYGNEVDIFDVSTGLYMIEDDQQYYTASFRSSSVRYQRKQELYREKKKTQAIIDNSNDGFIDWDTITNEIYVSQRLRDILGYELGDIPNNIESWLNLMHPHDRKEFLKNIERCPNMKDNINESEVLLKHKDKRWVWVLARSKMLIDENNEATRFILFFTYIDDRKGKEKIMKEKIAQGIEEIKEQQHLLAHQSKLASMGEMIGSIAHQWRQPLNELGIKVQSLKFQYKKGLIDETFINDFVNQNKKTIMFMSKTIDDFRSFYKTDKVKSDFSILESINFCFDMQSAELSTKNISISIDGNDFTINGLDSELKQVILNFINNSKDAFEENNIQNRKINVLLKDNEMLFIDNAGGIPEDAMPRIFEPYYTTKDQGQGTGIGLYMSKSIIENHNALLSVKNTNDGACFTIHFPDK